MAWCDDLQSLQTNVKYLMQTVEKPNFFVVPQLGQTVLPGKRANFLTACSAEADAICFSCNSFAAKNQNVVCGMVITVNTAGRRLRLLLVSSICLPHWQKAQTMEQKTHNSSFMNFRDPKLFDDVRPKRIIGVPWNLLVLLTKKRSSLSDHCLSFLFYCVYHIRKQELP